MSELTWLTAERDDARDALREIDKAVDDGKDQTSPLLFKVERLRKDRDALRLALRSFLFLFSRNEDGLEEDQIAGLPDSHAFEMIDQAAHRDVPIMAHTPCITVGQIRRARDALYALASPSVTEQEKT